MAGSQCGDETWFCLVFLPPSELLDTVKEMALPKSSVADRSAVNERSHLFIDGANCRELLQQLTCSGMPTVNLYVLSARSSASLVPRG